MTDSQVTIRIGHSPDPDDAFMFHALANEKFDTGPYRFVHELQDIETLNRRAFHGELELTAVSIHGYAYLTQTYALCACGASMGDGYGPMIVARQPWSLDEVRGKTIAVPGTLTTAFLALNLCLGGEPAIPAPEPHRHGDAGAFRYEVHPFDEILNLVERGKVDAGLIIHEGQLTYANQGLHLVRDLGAWWMETTGLPLPLGGNAIRKDLGEQRIKEVTHYLKRSIEFGLAHRSEALDHALQYGRDLDRQKADRFVGMYVNEWTIDFGERGRQAVRRLLDEGYQAGLIPNPIEVEFVTAD